MKTYPLTYLRPRRVANLLAFLSFLVTCTIAAGGGDVIPLPDSKSPKRGLRLGTQPIIQKTAENEKGVVIGSRLMLLDEFGTPTGSGIISSAVSLSQRDRIVWSADEGAVAIEFLNRIGGRLDFFAIEGDHLVDLPSVDWRKLLDDVIPAAHEITRVYPTFVEWKSSTTCVVELSGTAIKDGGQRNERDILDLEYSFQLIITPEKVHIERIVEKG